MGMRDDLQNSDLENKPVDDLDSLVDQFNTTLRTIFDKHALMKSRTLKNKRKKRGTRAKFMNKGN